MISTWAKIGEYDRIRLQLDAKDFVATASLAGSNQLGAKPATQLPPATLYDFTREELGSNPVLKLPPSSFRYLHVKLSAGITPAQVKGASVYNLQETKAAWTSVGSCGAPSQVARTTVIICDSPVRVPVDRVRFQIDPKQVNFRRAVVLSDASEQRYGGGEITRVRMNRAGTTVIAEEMDVLVRGQNSGRLKVTVDNGDNPPLSISDVELLSVERRVYFDPQGKSLLKLYYGDGKLGPPVYDYARFFKADPAAAKAELGPGTHNEAYRGRPDDRPWSERHKAVLWLAMLLAVIVLAALAIRGLKASSVILSESQALRKAKTARRSRRTPIAAPHSANRGPSTPPELRFAKLPPMPLQDDTRIYRIDSSTSEIQSGRFRTSRGLGPSAAPTMPSRSIRSIRWAARP